MKFSGMFLFSVDIWQQHYETLSHVPSQCRHLTTKLFQLCGCLVYLQAILLKEMTDKYEIGKWVRNVLINMINTVKYISRNHFFMHFQPFHVCYFYRCIMTIIFLSSLDNLMTINKNCKKDFDLLACVFICQSFQNSL